MVVGVDDLGTEEIRHILARASALRAGAISELTRPPLVGLLFLETSLRTRVGFAAAAARLGGQFIDIVERRGNAVAMPEGWADTLRVVSGYVDLIVARPGRPLDASTPLTELLTSSFLNGGDAGPGREHPSQALIDLYAIEQARGPVADLTVAICGDLRMRAVRSLVRLFARFPPRHLVTITDPGLNDGTGKIGTAEAREPWDVGDVDVLYVAGIPHGALDEPGRARLRVDRKALASLPPDAVVLSPMPVIDEIASTVRSDPRIAMFRQSDDALFVRMALIERLLSGKILIEALLV